MQGKRKNFLTYGGSLLVVGLVIGFIFGHFVSFNLITPQSVTVKGNVYATAPAEGYSNSTLTFSLMTTYCEEQVTLGSPSCDTNTLITPQDTYLVTLQNNQEYSITANYYLGNLPEKTCQGGVFHLNTVFPSVVYDVNCT